MKAKPNFFLVGAAKAGTTSIAESLSLRPDIFMSYPKEPNFFDRMKSFENLELERANYLNLFSDTGNAKIIGEASVSYLDSVEAAQNIFNFNPDAKILISLRNPVERAVSLYEMYCRISDLKETFQHVTVEDPWLKHQCYYYEKIKRYLDTFPRDQVFWVLFDDLKSDWNGTFEKIYGFLDVPIEKTEKPTIKNTGGVPKKKAYKIFTNRVLIETAKKIIPKKVHNIIDFHLKKSLFVKVKLDDDMKSYLKESFEDDLNKLSELLEYDFTKKWL